ncbi:hypothetical protein MRBLMA1_002699 [Sphingobium sp. LMA1-1-1.1]|uniref:hypothetical protein n=1 Tax=Sphingobium sp. LMA1-1-1.1 TaxID=3135238 RepID=UPI00342B7FA3
MPELMIDAHVHLHPGDDPWDRLMQAHERMMAAAGGKDCLAVFMLAEQQGCDAFGTLKASARTTAEPESLWLETGSADLLVLAGRQVVSAERLEMLALATAADFVDGAPAEQLIEAMDAADALIILPWGVGKWAGARGRLVDRLLAGDSEERLLLGDNGGRPAFWPERRFRHRTVLRGSDPLPLGGDARRIGTFGTMVQGRLSADRPGRDLRLLIRSTGRQARHYGALAGPLHFLGNQFRLRMAS